MESQPLMTNENTMRMWGRKLIVLISGDKYIFGLIIWHWLVSSPTLISVKLLWSQLCNLLVTMIRQWRWSGPPAGCPPHPPLSAPLSHAQRADHCCGARLLGAWEVVQDESLDTPRGSDTWFRSWSRVSCWSWAAVDQILTTSGPRSSEDHLVSAWSFHWSLPRHYFLQWSICPLCWRNSWISPDQSKSYFSSRSLLRGCSSLAASHAMYASILHHSEHSGLIMYEDRQQNYSTKHLQYSPLVQSDWGCRWRGWWRVWRTSIQSWSGWCWCILQHYNF